MSRGVYFTIVRKLDKSLTEHELEEFRDKLMKSRPSWDGEVSASSIADWEGYTPEPEKDDVWTHEPYRDVVNMHTGCMFAVTFRAEFNSSALSIAEALRVFPYPTSSSTDVVSSYTAASISEALRYLLSEDYSSTFEEVMRNPFIDDLSDMYTPYLDWQAGEPPARRTFMVKDERGMLQRLLTVFDAYEECRGNDCPGESKHLLLVTAWG